MDDFARGRPRRNIPSKSAADCFLCGLVFGGNEWIWRARVEDNWHKEKLAPVCGDCRPMPGRGTWFWERDAQPCEICSRPVVNMITMRDRIHTFCSEVCSRRYYSARQREARQQALDLDKVCECGTKFTAARSDASHCSSKCRQRAYRIKKKLELEG